MLKMEAWKWFICLTLFAAVLSDEVPEAPPSINTANIDLAKILPNQKDNLKVFLTKLIRANEKKQTAILNDYADTLLPHLNSLIVNISLDPTPMPDIIEAFEWKILLITYHGIMSLTDGWLHGLGTIQRKGDITLTYEYPIMKLHLPLRFENIRFNYNYKAQFMDLGPTGEVDGKVTGCRWTTDISINLLTLRAELERYNLDSLGTVSLKFSGNILVDWLVNVFVTVTIPLVKPVIKFIIEGFINDGLAAVLDVYNQVVCSLLANCPTEEFVNMLNAVPILPPSVSKASL